MANTQKYKKVGQRFKFDNGEQQSTYILARVSNNKVALIDLESGNRYCKATRVSGCNYTITQDEWKVITGGDYKHFKQDP